MGHCNNSIVIFAPAGQVWATVRDFHDMSWAAGIIESVEPVGSQRGDEPGTGRILNGIFHETLTGHDDAEMTLQYSIDDGPGPVAKDAVKNYVGTLRVFEVTADNTTFVQWSSTYDSPDDTAVGELCNPIYSALLQALKKHCEAGCP